MIIPFNKPYLDGTELDFLTEVLKSKHLAGNGKFTKNCQDYIEQKYGFRNVLLTSSCTDALEMCAILLDIKEGDEVIVPSYTFVTSALAFVRQGANIVLADSEKETPNINLADLAMLINDKTKAIVIVHYAGMAVDMNALNEIIGDRNIVIIEDAAHATDAYFNERPLGGIGHLGVFSFHPTKNITSGEGGLLVINDPKYIERAKIIWEKGTNRFDFINGAVDKYEWVDLGSSFLPSELNAALLWSQLLNLDEIQKKRKLIWKQYFNLLQVLIDEDKIFIPSWPQYAYQNGHTFYIYASTIQERNDLIAHLKSNGVSAYFHYTPLHLSAYYKKKFKHISLPNAEHHGHCLLRLPLFTQLTQNEIEYVVNLIKEFYK